MKTRSAVLMTVALLTSVLVACSPSPTTSVPPTPCPEELGIYDGWYAAGDSAFTGVGWRYRGAPSQIDGLLDRSYPGDTLVKLKLLSFQPTITDRITATFCREGVVPRNIVIHAGAADLIARATWNEKFPLLQYTQQIQLINDWLNDLGVERIVWTTVVPMTDWALHSSENSLRLDLNNWLRTSGLEVVDCEAPLTNEFGWLPTSLALNYEISPRDGAHLNSEGVRLHAQCIIDGIGDPVLTLKE